MIRKIIAAALLAMGALSATAAANERLRFAVTDVDGLEALQREYGPFKSAFEKASGIRIDMFPVSGRTAAVEAMAAGQVDLVLTGPAEYVVFNARLKAQPVVVWTRPDYYSQIVTLDGGPVDTVDKLKGRKISVGEIGSTSQHLGPAQILRDKGLAYGRDYEAVFLRLNVAVEAMIRGDVAAIGMNRTHLERITKAYPDRKFRVLEKGPILPDDLIVAAPTVKPETVAIVRKAFVDHADPIMKAVASTAENAKFVGGVFRAEVKDSDYDVVRSMYRAVNVNEFTRFIGN
ncbi:MAG: PhnD/SsuA/transferrin family substrate-binding protein [Beijerinckiaceae bacterium]